MNNETVAYVPGRGDIIWVDLNPRTGHEQSGRRPVLVLSCRLLSQKTHLALVVPITTQVKGLPFEVALAGCRTKGVILPIHLRSIDIVARKAELIEKAPAAIVETAVRHAKALLA